jgi:hypothetical protein
MRKLVNAIGPTVALTLLFVSTGQAAVVTVDLEKLVEIDEQSARKLHPKLALYLDTINKV